MLPNFLCIGAPKAGTSWLYDNIRLHPDAWMPPIKEIHYFDGWPPQPLIMSVLNPRTFTARRLALRRLLRKRSRSKWDVSWHLCFLLLPRTDRWYASLFPPNRGQIAGDITPTYASMGKKRVAQVHALLPNAKLIYLLRNPVTQMWSQAAMHFRIWHRRELKNVTDKSIKRYFDSKKRVSPLDYTKHLQTWRLFFPARQIHIEFFDRLVQDPPGLLRDIYRFLGLDASDQFIPKTVHEKRNAKPYPAMPDHLARYLADQYHEQIEQLHQRYHNRYTASWLDVTEQYLAP